MPDWPDMLEPLAPPVDLDRAADRFVAARVRRRRRRQLLRAGASAALALGVGAAALQFATGDRGQSLRVESPVTSTMTATAAPASIGFEVLAENDADQPSSAFATDDATYNSLWGTFGLSLDQPSVDFARSIVIGFSFTDEGCRSRLQGFSIAPDGLVVAQFNADTSVSGPPTSVAQGCPTNIVRRSLVVALDRAALPETFKLIRVPPFFKPEVTYLTVSLPPLGLTSTPNCPAGTLIEARQYEFGWGTERGDPPTAPPLNAIREMISSGMLLTTQQPFELALVGQTAESATVVAYSGSTRMLSVQLEGIGGQWLPSSLVYCAPSEPLPLAILSFSVVPESGERTLTVPTQCSRTERIEIVSQTAEQVVLRALGRRVMGDCRGSGTVTLDAPLGGRVIIDATTGNAVRSEFG